MLDEITHPAASDAEFEITSLLSIQMLHSEAV